MCSRVRSFSFLCMYVQNVGCPLQYFFLIPSSTVYHRGSSDQPLRLLPLGGILEIEAMTLHSLTHFSLMYVCVHVGARYFAKKKKLENLLNSLCAMSGRLWFLLSICAQYKHVNTQINFFCSGK